MSFGFSIGDGVMLTRLVWRTIEGTRKACGEYNEMTREARSLAQVFERLHNEITTVDSVLHRAKEDRKRELSSILRRARRLLEDIEDAVEKHNDLRTSKGGSKKLLQKIRFGNGKTKQLDSVRVKMATYTAAITINLNLLSMDGQGRIENQVESLGGDLRGIQESVNFITAKLSAKAEAEDGSVWTTYANDDRMFWRRLRRELNQEGFTDQQIRKHERPIMAYIRELGEGGFLDSKPEVSQTFLPTSSKIDLVATGTIDHGDTTPPQSRTTSELISEVGDGATQGRETKCSPNSELSLSKTETRAVTENSDHGTTQASSSKTLTITHVPEEENHELDLENSQELLVVPPKVNDPSDVSHNEKGAEEERTGNGINTISKLEDRNMSTPDKINFSGAWPLFSSLDQAITGVYEETGKKWTLKDRVEHVYRYLKETKATVTGEECGRNQKYSKKPAASSSAPDEYADYLQPNYALDAKCYVCQTKEARKETSKHQSDTLKDDASKQKTTPTRVFQVSPTGLIHTVIIWPDLIFEASSTGFIRTITRNQPEGTDSVSAWSCSTCSTCFNEGAAKSR
jgi:hypothetical protein